MSLWLLMAYISWVWRTAGLWLALLLFGVVSPLLVSARCQQFTKTWSMPSPLSPPMLNELLTFNNGWANFFFLTSMLNNMLQRIPIWVHIYIYNVSLMGHRYNSVLSCNLSFLFFLSSNPYTLYSQTIISVSLEPFKRSLFHLSSHFHSHHLSLRNKKMQADTILWIYPIFNFLKSRYNNSCIVQKKSGKML